MKWKLLLALLLQQTFIQISPSVYGRIDPSAGDIAYQKCIQDGGTDFVCYPIKQNAIQADIYKRYTEVLAGTFADVLAALKANHIQWVYDATHCFGDCLMAITQNGSPSLSTFNAPVTSVTFSHTVNAGSNTVLRVMVAWRTETGTPAANASVTYNGVAMTPVANTKATATFPTNYEWDSQQFVLVAPATGANNVVITLTNAGGVMGVADAWDGVDQTTPAHNGTNDASQSSTTPSLVVTSATGEIVLGGFCVVAATAVSTDTDQGDATQGGLVQTGGASYANGAATVTLGWSGTPLAGNWTLSGMSLKQAGGAVANQNGFFMVLQ